jgi:predicted glycogen debranching enzyme
VKRTVDGGKGCALLQDWPVEAGHPRCYGWAMEPLPHDPLLSGVRRELVVEGASPEALLDREWLVTNGLGGYASASVAGLATRKYHGLLVAALPEGLGRTVMLNHLIETVVLPDGRRLQLSGEELHGGALALPGVAHLRGFALEGGLPVWRYDVDGARLERRVVMPQRQNTAVLLWRLEGGTAPLTLELRPAVHFRHHEQDLGVALQPGYRRHPAGQGAEAVHEIRCDGGPAALRLRLDGPGAAFHDDERVLADLHHRVEAARGYPPAGRLWSPGAWSVTLTPGSEAALVASTEPLPVMAALPAQQAFTAERERRGALLRMAPPALRQGVAAELVLAADAFVVVPAGRTRDAARARAEGDELRSVIAGYHWFTDWGRDTMISLEGLLLCTGRTHEAASLLRSFSLYVRDGLLPNLFPDGSQEGLYHTADATLWFFHALDRYHRVTADDTLLRRLLPTMLDIAEHHVRGTRFGIGVDPADGLLRQGAEGVQLTWMDAKCDGWVVTPRRGKAVEINALWFNALSVLAHWLSHLGDEAGAARWRAAARRVHASFNRRFWYPAQREDDGEAGGTAGGEAGGGLYDVVDGPEGDSAECRPNQLLALSLPHPVLHRDRWATVLRTVQDRLLTPVGLRSLAPGSAHYAPRYFGDLRTRDAAYHQGTVWAWLIGPWIDAWRRCHPDDEAGAQAWLGGLLSHLGEFGVGSIAEVFDAEPPYTPRGCIAQAWSVAETLRQLRPVERR